MDESLIFMGVPIVFDETQDDQWIYFANPDPAVRERLERLLQAFAHTNRQSHMDLLAAQERVDRECLKGIHTAADTVTPLESTD